MLQALLDPLGSQYIPPLSLEVEIYNKYWICKPRCLLILINKQSSDKTILLVLEHLFDDSYMNRYLNLPYDQSPIIKHKKKKLLFDKKPDKENYI